MFGRPVIARYGSIAFYNVEAYIRSGIACECVVALADGRQQTVGHVSRRMTDILVQKHLSGSVSNELSLNHVVCVL
jgi:hypothetical protein